MIPYRRVTLQSSLGKIRAYIIDMAGSSLTWNIAQDDIIEGSTMGSITFNPDQQTYAPLTADFYIYGKGRNYLVRKSGILYILYGGPNTSYGQVAVIGQCASGYFSFMRFIHDTTYDTYGVDYPIIYGSNATGNDPVYTLTQTQTDGTKLGYAVVTYRRQNLQATVTNTAGDVGSVKDVTIKDILGNAVIAEGDPYDNLPTGGDEPIPGGGTVSEPGLPGLSAASTGIMGLFCPTAAQMQQLADFMWTDFGGQGTTVIEVLEEIVEAIKRAISNPLDYILGLNIIPSQGLSVGGSKVVKFGFVSSGVSMPILSDHYFIVDCGSVSFDVLCGDSFLDYAPYSKFSIYLPYIGFKDIDPNDCVGHTISVKYHGDAITGGLTAYVFKDGAVMYQYSGGCALNVPLSSDNWGATIASAASIATGIIGAAATGGAAGVGAAAAKGAASVAANPSLLSPQVMHSGAVSGAPGFMGVQYPFIIREAVNFHSTAGFNKESGYPSYYYKTFSDVTGFTTILDPHINNIPQATQGEVVEIISLLESGVIL